MGEPLPPLQQSHTHPANQAAEDVVRDAVAGKRLVDAQVTANQLAVRGHRLAKLLDDPLQASLAIALLEGGVPPTTVALPRSAHPIGDPWRSLGVTTPGTWSVAITLIGGRQVTLRRRVTDRSDGGKTLEIGIAGEHGAVETVSPELLPLYGIQDLSDGSDVVVLCEGVPSADALIGRDIAAVGTLTGRAHLPSPDALAPLVKKAASVVLWPEGDVSSARFLKGVGALLAVAGMKALRIVEEGAADPASVGSVRTMKRLINGARPWDPAAQPPRPSGYRPLLRFGSGSRLAVPDAERPEARLLAPAPASAATRRPPEAPDRVQQAGRGASPDGSPPLSA